MADGTIQVPPDSTGSKVDGASLPVGGNTVIRQRMVIGDNSATAQFATVTGGALLVVHNGSVNISAMPTVTVTGGVAISGTVVLAAGTANIGSINNISATLSTVLAAGTANIGTINNISAAVVLAAGANNIGTINNISAAVVVTLPANIGIVNSISAPVVLAAGAANIGSINGISATVNTSSVVTGFSDPSGTTRNVVDSANLALRVNVVAGSAGGPSMVDNTTFSTGASNLAPAGFIFFSASATVVTDGRLAAGRITDSRAQHVNLRNNAGTEIGTATTPLSVKVENTSATAAVVIAAGAANIGFLNHISATVNCVVTGFRDNSGNTIQIVDSANIALRVAGYGTLGSLPIGGFIDGSGTNRNVVDSVNLALRVTVTTPLNINAISQTVTVTTALPWVIAQPSASHGPITVVASTSAQATLIAAPGAGLHIYVTELVLTNAGSALTGAQVGPTGSAGQVTMVVGATGGNARMSFDPPWKLQSNTAAVCKLDPSPGGNFYFVVNFFVAA